MKKLSTNIALYVHIAENGGSKEKERIRKAANISTATLCKILKGHMPLFETRYQIYKLTGIKLNELDEFPEQKQNAS
jgi:predicted transcriptional regulator